MKIYKALIDIEKKCPELFLLVNSLKIESCEKCPTAYAQKINDTSFKIVINKTWAENFDTFNLSALIEHELLHIVLGHCSQLESYHDKKTANIAMDAIINDIGYFISQKKELNNELSGGIFLDAINEKFDSNFSAKKHTSLQLYNFLMAQKENDLDDLGQPFDMGDMSDDNIDLKEMLSDSAYESIVKKYSEKSGELKEMLFEIEKREKNKVIKKEIEKFFQSNKADKKQSIKRRNKRFLHLPYGRISSKSQKILLALDVSGSMLNPEDMAKIKMVIYSAINNMFEIDLIFGDTKKIGEFKGIKKNFDMAQIRGGGGTDLKFIFDENISSYDCFVIVTDGEFNHGCIPNLKNKFLFLNTTDNPISGHKNIFI